MNKGIFRANILIILLIGLMLLSSCGKKEKKSSKMNIMVSILPQKYFVEKITGDLANVEVMVKPGYSPASYDPSPRQMLFLSDVDIFFVIGVAFEKALLPKLDSQLRVIDTSHGIKKKKVKTFYEIVGDVEDDHHDHEHHDHDGELDPHIWLSPTLVKKQAEIIYNEMIELDPENKAVYQENYNKFISELTSLKISIKQKLSGLKYRNILVFHPAWGYFCEEFGLHQIPIEIRGKSSSSRQMSEIIRIAKANYIRNIFIQEQFSSHEAKAIAEALSGKVVKIDPLAEDYINNLNKIADILSENL